MVASQLIENKIAGIEPTKVFTIEDLGFPHDWWENVRVKLGRMVKLGLIEKVGRGKYYSQKHLYSGISDQPRVRLSKTLCMTMEHCQATSRGTPSGIRWDLLLKFPM